ncbi:MULTISPECIES: tyrosine-protein phosphatase [unclassified Luteococcus]|uniref:tyrosine-protein phosphatase n=1 Tax=unclassified Luteococcus TaxID=2639923 RepID=UPI00313E06AE
MNSLSLLRAATHRVNVPFGVYNLRPVTATTRPGTGVYRSSLLWGATAADRRRIQELGIRLVIDLRTVTVAANFPDPPLEGVRHRLIDLHGTGHSTPGQRITEADTIAAMQARYRRMVTDEGQRERIGETLRAIADEPGAVLFHCTDGKDRTGWIALLLQHIHGDYPAQIRADYLASQPLVDPMMRLRWRLDRARGGRKRALRNRPMNMVDLAFLQAGLDEVTARHGGLDGYLRDGLGIDEVTRHRLRTKL